MAIHSDHPGVKVEVVVDGQALREYEDPSDISEAHTVARYIEAITGASFWVKVDIEAHVLSRAVGVRMTIDGKPARDRVYKPSNKARTINLQKIREKIDGRVFLSEMRFSELLVSK